MRNDGHLEKATIRAEYSRHYPDPLNRGAYGSPLSIEHHVLVSRAVDIPPGISKAPNPRVQRTDKGIYKEVRTSLANGDDLSFHLKNKGITILAQRIEYSTDRRTACLYFGDGEGIVDGAHTYQIILEAQKAGTCPEGQYVKLEVLTGVPLEMGPDITGGLNTAVQVDDSSLMNLKKDFEWVKETLKDTDYGDRISYKQNEEGDYDIREILGIMTLFNVGKFPYSDGKHPKEAYTSKAKCLSLFKHDPDSFKMLRPLLKDILYLYDYVQIRGRERYNDEMGGRAGGMTGVYAKRARGTHSYVFMGEERDFWMYDGVLYPMLGAMRFLVEQKPGQDVYSWRFRAFGEVKSFFDEVAADLVATTYKTSLNWRRKPNAVGKDDTHWDNMYKTVALHFLTNYA